MKSYHRIIFFILVLILVLILIHIPRLCIDTNKNIDNKNHGEDSYQKYKSNKNNLKCRIFNWTYGNLKNEQVEDYYSKFESNFKNIFDDFFPNQKEHYIFLEDVPFDKIKTMDVDCEIVSVWINKEHQIIRFCFNHEWCGGNFFVMCMQATCNGIQCKIPSIPKNIPLIVEYSFLKAFFQKPYQIENKGFNLLKNRNDLKRINFNLDKDNKPKNINTRTYILWQVLKNISLACPQKEDYNIGIPVVFKREKGIDNNIGIILVKWNKKDGYKKLEKEIDKNKYFALVSNYYLRKNNTNKKIGSDFRKSLDLVFSSAYVNSCEFFEKRSMTTYNDVADYGIYCMTMTNGTNINVSLTFNTNDVNTDLILKNISNAVSF